MKESKMDKSSIEEGEANEGINYGRWKRNSHQQIY